MIEARRNATVRILLLEDSSLDAELIQVQLDAAGLGFALDRVWTLETFQDAVTSGRYDVILSDHLLRGFDGHDALAIAREHAPDIPFIFVSGTLSEEIAVEALKQGARDYVVKQRLQRLPDAILRALRENEERKKLAQAELALKQSREQLLTMADALPALIAHLDLDHRYRFGNDAHGHWFGVSTERLAGMHLAEIVGTDAFDGMREALSAVAGGSREAIEVRLPIDGADRVRYVSIDCVPETDETGQVGGYYMLARDITELKDAELSLRRSNVKLERQVQARTAELEGSQNRLAAIFESSFQLQILVDTDGQVVDANAASLNAILAEKSDVLGRPLDVLPWFGETPDVVGRIRRAVTEALEGTAFQEELELHLPTGKRSFEVSLRPLHGADGRPGAIVVEAVETTARRQAEHALRQSQKIEALGQLTGGMAHDFNNILTIIAGSTELAKTLVGNPGAADRATRALDHALKGVASAAALTHRLLAFARRQPLKTAPTDVNRQLASMRDMLNRTLGELVRLRVVTEPRLWSVEVDAAQLEAAVINLAVNARDAMPRGGELTIETGNLRIGESDLPQLPEMSPGEYVMLRVKDTGEGMSPEIMTRVFEPFFTTKEVGRGTGLGLPMVYGFVHQSNGHVALESEEGVGTRFTMFFPRSRQAVEALPHEAPDDLIETSHDATVLVAEDNDQVRAYVVEVLRDIGYHVLEAHDGFAALRLLERPDVVVDMLFSDVVMPGMAGWELAQKARAIAPDLRVLFTSGYPRNIEGNEQVAREAGILAKPFTRSELASAVAATLSGPKGLVSPAHR